MRLRALPLLLALTAADYALWDWSIADGHDLVSLIAGLTLLPLAAATLALLAVGAARLVGLVLERSSARERGGERLRAGAGGAPAARVKRGGVLAGGATGPAGQAEKSPQPAETAAARERSSRRLAA